MEKVKGRRPCLHQESPAGPVPFGIGAAASKIYCGMLVGHVTWVKLDVEMPL